ncbi:sigma-70 family RNA polymerase sigma factor, partial [Streptomyces sp. NPDC005534]|uniref:sigma-70 family RNA polymerase sigma factor n=1 Tax=Streptomyces sp. NPDC005534 TaxID=3155714 RepID=UPI003454B728
RTHATHAAHHLRVFQIGQVLRRLRTLRCPTRVAAPADHEDPVADRAAARAGAQAVGRELAAALAALPARHRDVLLLVAWGGLGYEEVAQALDVPIGTVRSRLHRARGRLRQALGGSDPTTLREEPRHDR